MTIDNTLQSHTNTCIYLPDQYYFIRNLSFMMLVSALNVFYHGHYDMCIMVIIVQFTSILYWSKPEYNWKRNLDMVCANGTVLYHCVRAYGSDNSILFYIFTSFGVLCYFYSWKYYYQNEYWYSTYLHSAVHVFFNIAMNTLYIGHIVSICNNEIIIYGIDKISLLQNDNYFRHCENSHREQQLLNY